MDDNRSSESIKRYRCFALNPQTKRLILKQCCWIFSGLFFDLSLL